MTKGAGKGLLGDILGRGAVEAADLESAYETPVVCLVDLDEVARRTRGRIGSNLDSLTQRASDPDVS